MRRGTAGEAASLLASAEASLLEAAGAPPPRLAHGAAAQTAEVAHGGFRQQGLEDAVQEAIAAAIAAAAEANAAASAATATDGRRRRRRPLEPNQSQVAAPLCALLTTYYYEYSTCCTPYFSLPTYSSFPARCALLLATHQPLLTPY